MDIGAELHAVSPVNVAKVVNPLKTVFVPQRGNRSIDTQGIQARDIDSGKAAGGRSEHVEIGDSEVRRQILAVVVADERVGDTCIGSAELIDACAGEHV